MPAREMQGLNLSALDSMVSDFMASEACIEDKEPVRANKDVKQKCEAVCQSILEGDIDTAITLIENIDCSILQDLRLVFRLKKQKLVELLRKGGTFGDSNALGWIRSELAPLALNAYPEAYLEFKKSLLLLIYDKDRDKSPVVEEWSIKARSELAGLVFTTLRQTAGVKDPLLVMLLKYLLFIHDQYHAEQQDTACETEIMKELCWHDRLPALLPREGYVGEPFPTKDVQAIVQAVGIRQEDAIESLKHVDGDISAAFENELARMQLNRHKLHEMVLEYAGYRGFLNLPNSHGLGASSFVQMDDLPDSNSSEGPDVFLRSAKDMSMSIHESSSRPIGGQHVEEMVEKSERHIPHGEESVSAPSSPSHCPPKKMAKIWSKQLPVFSCGEAVFATEALTSTTDGSKKDITSKHGPANVFTCKCDPKLVQILHLLRMVKEGHYLTVIDRISEMDSNFFDRHAHLLFELWRFEVLKAAATGAHDTALEIVRKKLAPIVNTRGALFYALQETLSSIMASNHEPPSPVMLCSSLQTALQESLKLPGPVLVRLLKGLLFAHQSWYHKQRRQDVFQKLLGIDVLQQGESTSTPNRIGLGPLPSEGSSPNRRELEEGQTEGSPEESPMVEVEMDDGLESDWGVEDSGLGTGLDETAIGQVMQVLALPRAAAVDLLMQHDRNVETAIWSVIND